ncbi:KaiC domain-containing protein [Halorubellus sp. JP-L1]|uniref:KaiC domain-containing protein n=1 Tax=Halorubellus sp. JP-L1 TaxID=2715753 RepID=UPI00140B6223|nr:KaiC domain-containing protein [Halorubellus sp. JP-L1]NHN41290.1 KaiC domain-containing protein [Halorubellus sp. JP-L1]
MSDDDDEDWFERALGEDPSEDDIEDAPDDWDDWDDWAGDRPESDGDAADGTGATGSADADVEPPRGDDESASGGATRDGESDADESDGDGLFEDDFAAAMGDAPDAAGPGGPSGGGGGTGAGEDLGGGMDVDDEFGMGGDGGDEFGMGGGGGGGEFGMGGDGGDEFGMGGGGGGGEFGMGGGGGGFEADEEYETDLARIDLGIEGLDEMIQGGVPERSLMVTIGSAGTGKTTFALQFLHEALQQGERAIYITLEESRERVINSATEKGLEFDSYADDGQLAVVDLDPIEMANSLRSIRSELPRLIEAFDATRLALDSVSLLEMMYEDRAKRRNEIYDFTRSLKEAGVTTMLTSEASDRYAYTSRHGIVEYLTDAVFVLQYVRPDDFRETRLAIEIQKIRDANHSRETKPYEITNEGLSVYRQANIF